MDSRFDLTFQIFEKFGAPAFAAVAGRGGASVDPREDAAKVSALLVKAGQAGAALAALGGGDSGDKGESAARLALGGVCASLLSALYRDTGRLPSESEIERLKAVFTAILSFAEGFSAIADGAGRLSLLGEEVPLDETQIEAMVLHAFVPVVEAVASFSFGTPEKKLAQEIAGRLTADAVALSERFSARELNLSQRKLAELSVVRTLALLFSLCYENEKTRLLALDEAARAALAEEGLPLDPVWAAYSVRLAMMETLAQGVFSERPVSGPGPALVDGIPSTSLQSAPDSDKSSRQPTAPAQTSAPEKPAGPMGFFKKKKDETDA